MSTNLLGKLLKAHLLVGARDVLHAKGGQHGGVSQQGRAQWDPHSRQHLQCTTGAASAVRSTGSRWAPRQRLEGLWHTCWGTIDMVTSVSTPRRPTLAPAVGRAGCMDMWCAVKCAQAAVQACMHIYACSRLQAHMGVRGRRQEAGGRAGGQAGQVLTSCQVQVAVGVGGELQEGAVGQHNLQAAQLGEEAGGRGRRVALMRVGSSMRRGGEEKGMITTTPGWPADVVARMRARCLSTAPPHLARERAVAHGGAVGGGGDGASDGLRYADVPGRWVHQPARLGRGKAGSTHGGC